MTADEQAMQAKGHEVMSPETRAAFRSLQLDFGKHVEHSNQLHMETKYDLKEIKRDVKDVLTQTIKTNGRVNDLEEWQESRYRKWVNKLIAYKTP